MDRAGFQRALDLARRGRTRADTGADRDTREALEAVAKAAPNAPSALVRAARAAWRESLGQSPSGWRH